MTDNLKEWTAMDKQFKEQAMAKIDKHTSSIDDAFEAIEKTIRFLENNGHNDDSIGKLEILEKMQDDLHMSLNGLHMGYNDE